MDLKRNLSIMVEQRESAGGGTNEAWQIEIITPDGEALHPRATLVELATMDGQIGVMPGHERLVTVLEVGELVVHNGREQAVYLVGGGFARIQPERLSVLACSLERDTDGAAFEKCRARQRALLRDDEIEANFDAVDEHPPPPKSAIDSPRIG